MEEYIDSLAGIYALRFPELHYKVSMWGLSNLMYWAACESKSIEFYKYTMLFRSDCRALALGNSLQKGYSLPSKRNYV